MPTVIGIIFLAASVFCFFLGDDELFALLIFSSIFQSSSVIALKDAGVTPYYLVGAVFVLQGIYRYARGGKERAKQASFKGKWWMVAFGVIAIVSAFTLPFVFAGIPVYEQHIGIDDGFFLRPPLQFRNANISHSVSLLLGVLIVLGAAKRVRNGVLTGRAYLFTFYVLAGIITVQFLCLLLGIEFPYALLQNNAGGSMQMVDTRDFASRFPGTFTESSAAGQVLVCFTAGFLAERLKVGRSLIPVGVGLAAIMLVRSSTAIVAIAVVIGLLCLWHPIFRFPFYINLVRLRRVALLLVLGALVLALAIFSPLRDSLIMVTLQKQESGSFVNRLASDAYALNLFVMTKGIGVGMGSNRPSSLITSLLSTVGWVGLIVFLLAYFKLLSNVARNRPDLLWAGLSLFLCIAIAGPDYDTPWIWVFLAFAVQMGSIRNQGIGAIRQNARSFPRERTKYALETSQSAAIP